MSVEDELKESDKNISECYAMIDHFIQLKDRGVEFAVEELAYWRKMLSIAKYTKRRLLST